ncbi:hypothetical protein K7432_004643 [Basidiobolus ranarum]
MYLVNLKLKGLEVPNQLPDQLRRELQDAMEKSKHTPRSRSIPIQPSVPNYNLDLSSTPLSYGSSSFLSSSPSFSTISQSPSKNNGIDWNGGNQHNHSFRSPIGFDSPDKYSAFSSISSDSSWKMSSEDKAKFLAKFKTLDTNRLGYISGDLARNFFLQTSLPPNVLMQIWNLADTRGSGKLDDIEFAIAMHLIYGKLAGKELPLMLPAELTPYAVRNIPDKQYLFNMIAPNPTSTAVNYKSLADTGIFSKQHTENEEPTNLESQSHINREALKKAIQEKRRILNELSQPSYETSQEGIEQLQKTILEFQTSINRIEVDQSKDNQIELIHVLDEKYLLVMEFFKISEDLRKLKDLAYQLNDKLATSKLDLFMKKSNSSGSKLDLSKVFPTHLSNDKDHSKQHAAELLVSRMNALSNKSSDSISDRNHRVSLENQAIEEAKSQSLRLIQQIQDKVESIETEVQKSFLDSKKGSLDNQDWLKYQSELVDEVRVFVDSLPKRNVSVLQQSTKLETEPRQQRGLDSSITQTSKYDSNATENITANVNDREAELELLRSSAQSVRAKAKALGLGSSIGNTKVSTSSPTPSTDSNNNIARGILKASDQESILPTSSTDSGKTWTIPTRSDSMSTAKISSDDQDPWGVPLYAHSTSNKLEKPGDSPRTISTESLPYSGKRNIQNLLPINSRSDSEFTLTHSGAASANDSDYSSKRDVEDSDIQSSVEDFGVQEMTRVKALYAYEARNDNDLSFSKGSIIILDETVDKLGDWWYGRLDKSNNAGYFPSNYVEIVAEIDDESDDEILKAKALYDYTAQREDEMDLNEGMVIIIVDKSDSDWWLARYGSLTGLVPANYLEELPIQRKLRKSSIPPRQLRKSSLPSSSYPGILGRKGSHSASALGSSYGKSGALGPSRLSKQLPPKLVLTMPGTMDDDTDADTDDTARKDALLRNQTLRRRRGSESASSRFLETRQIRRSISLNSLNDPNILESVPCARRWAQCVGSNYANSVNSEERKRQESIFELISTEQTYLRDLQLVMDVFYEPMQSMISEKELVSIFGNIEELLHCNTEFLNQLEERQNDNHFMIDYIGDIFLEHSNEFRQYLAYCGNQMNAYKLLQKKREDQTICQFLKDCMRSPECRNLDLSSFLLEPMQRITRYPLLLRQILHYTSKDHDDYQYISQALEKAEGILHEANRVAKIREDEGKLKEISSLVDFTSSEEKLDLMLNTRLLGPRQFVMEGILVKAKSGRKLQAFLFNDLLLLTQFPRSSLKNVGSNRYPLYRDPIPLNEMVAREVPRGFNQSGVDETTFQIVHIEEVITVKCSSVSTKRKWMNELEAARTHYLDIERQVLGPGTTPAHPIGTLQVTVLEGEHLATTDQNNTIVSPYVELKLDKQKLRTKVIKYTPNPKWNQSLVFSVTSLDEVLNLQVYSYEKFAEPAYMGQAELGLHLLEYYGERQMDAIKLELQDVVRGSLHVRLNYRRL